MIQHTKYISTLPVKALLMIFCMFSLMNCRAAIDNSSLKNNDEPVEDPGQSSTVLIYAYTPFGQGSCTGSIIDKKIHILTAAHCVVFATQNTQTKQWEVIMTSKVIVVVGKQKTSALKIVPNPKYVELMKQAAQKANEEHADIDFDLIAAAPYDEAIITVWAGLKIPDVKHIAKEPLKPGDRVTISGYGQLNDSNDEDNDGIPDYINGKLNDMCSLPPQGKPVHQKGTYRGCAESQRIDYGKHFTPPHSCGVLRQGTNTVQDNCNGIIYIEGPITPKAKPGEGKQTDHGFYNDITDEESAAFIKQESAECKCGYYKGKCIVWQSGKPTSFASVSMTRTQCSIQRCATEPKLRQAIYQECGGTFTYYNP